MIIKSDRYMFTHSKPPPKSLHPIIEGVARCDRVPPPRMMRSRIPTFREIAVMEAAKELSAAEKLAEMKSWFENLGKD